MNKTELWKKVQEILAKHKVEENEALYTELTLLLAVKKREVVKKAPIYEDDGKTIRQLYCDYLEKYLDVSEFTLSKGHKYGYSYNSKQAKLEMKKYSDKIKSLEKEVKDSVNLLLEGEITTDELGKIKAKNDELIAKYKLAREAKEIFEEAVSRIEQPVDNN